MNDFLRRYSQAGRVMTGFGLLSLSLLGIASLGAWLLRSRGAATEAAWLLLAGALLCALGLLTGWWVRHSIKHPVESTAQAVMRVSLLLSRL